MGHIHSDVRPYEPSNHGAQWPRLRTRVGEGFPMGKTSSSPIFLPFFLNEINHENIQNK